MYFSHSAHAQLICLNSDFLGPCAKDVPCDSFHRRGMQTEAMYSWPFAADPGVCQAKVTKAKEGLLDASLTSKSILLSQPTLGG
jgi:hypothetical protein